jgi:3-deoxy-D-manno-octulosonate 8-phosphate phosphatase (KDO 8-P phosphatase)
LKNKVNTLDNIDVFVFDFDGVLTNDLVHVNQDGKEWVSCHRSDGLAFDVLRKLKKPAFIISTETNSVVGQRAKKLKINSIQGVEDKASELEKLARNNNFNLSRTMYVGNDINDYNAMMLCGFSACPSDSHKEILKISNILLKKKGGHGVVRELLEDTLNIDFLKILYS